MICPECGTTIYEGQLSCFNCGVDLTQTVSMTHEDDYWKDENFYTKGIKSKDSNEKLERIRLKRIFYLSIGIFVTTVSVIFIGASLTNPGHGMSALFVLLFAIFFNLILWAVIYYAISKLDEDSKSSYLNVAGTFFVLFLPVYFLLSTLILFELDIEEGIGICWYGYCVFLMIYGIRTIHFSMKEKTDDMNGAIFTIIFGIFIILILLFIRVPLIG
jgi:hypothetical protein